MKALSVSSGFAALIGSGEKTIECRTWQTHYRGELLICSNKDRIPGTIPGHALHIVRLCDVRPFTLADIGPACMLKSDFSKGLWAWVLEYVSPVIPVSVRGKPGLFDVPDDEISRIDEASLSPEEMDALISQHFTPLIVV